MGGLKIWPILLFLFCCSLLAAQRADSLSYFITAPEDDAGECGYQLVTFTSKTIVLGACLWNGKEYAPYVELRFRNIQITDAEQIDSAFLQFSPTGSELVINPIPLKITGHPDPYPPPFSYEVEVYSISSKPRTENYAV